MIVTAHDFTIYVIGVLTTVVTFQWIYHFGAPRIYKSLIPKEYDGLNTRKQAISCSAICSVTNGTIMFSTSFYLLLTHNLHKDMCWTDDFETRFLSCIEMGAYFSDTLILLGGNNEPNVLPYLLHHLAIVFGSYISIRHGVFAYFLCLRGINELSVPFQHARHVLYDIGWKNSRIYMVNGLCFLFTFFISRICVIPVTVYSVFTIWGTTNFERVNLFNKTVFLGGALAIDTLNVYWFSLIARGAYKVLIKNKHP